MRTFSVSSSPRRALGWQVPLLACLAGVAVWLWTMPAREERALRSASLQTLVALRNSRPDDARVLYFYGTRLLDLGQVASANDVLLGAAKRDADSESVWLAAAQASAATHGDAAGIFLLADYAKRHPESAPAHARLAQLLARAKAIPRAYNEACAATRIDPHDAASWQLRGVEATLLHRLPDALTAMQQAILLAPSDWRNQVGLGQTLEALGRSREALGCYREAVRRAPDVEWPAYYLGKALSQRGGSPAAVQAARRMVQQAVPLPHAASFAPVEPLHTPTPLLLHDADTLLASGKRTEAQAAYVSIATHDTASTSACLGAAQTCEAQGQTNAAVGWYITAAKRDPRCVPALGAIANRIFEVGMMKEAAARYRDIVALQPAHAEAWHNLGVALRSQQADWGEGEAALRKAAALAPNNGDYWLDLGEMLWKRYHLAEAKTCYRHALALHSDNLRAQSELGALLLENGPSPQSRAEAERLLKQVLTLLPENDYALFYLGKSALERNQPRQAVAYLQRAAAHHLMADPLRVQHTLYRAYTQSGDTARAKTAQAEADKLRALNAAGKLAEDKLRDNPNDPLLHLQMARLYARNRQGLRALEQYRQCLELASNNRPARAEMKTLEAKLRAEGQSEGVDKYYAIVALPLASKVSP